MRALDTGIYKESYNTKVNKPCHLYNRGLFCKRLRTLPQPSPISVLPILPWTDEESHYNRFFMPCPLLQSMPILRSFCLFAGAGVLFLYIFAITFFVG